MLYDAVRNPHAPYQPPKISISPSKDTLESTQQRLQREMLGKFQNKGLELPHESYIAVVQVGKYVFLAVMLPVYLCIYGIPRWFLVTALPLFFMEIKNQSMRVGRFIKEMNKRIVDLMKGMLEQFIGDALRLFRDRAKNFWRRYFTKARQFTQKISHLGKRCSAQIQKFKHWISKTGEELYDQAEYNAKTTHQWMVYHFQAIFKEAVKKSLKILQVIDQTVFSPFIKRLLIPFQKMINFYQYLKKKTAACFKKIKNQLGKIIAPLVFRLVKGGKYGKQIAKKVLAPITKWIRQKKVILEKRFQKIKQVCIDRFVSLTLIAKAKIAPLFLAVLSFLKKWLLFIYTKLKKITEKVKKKISPRFKNQKLFVFHLMKNSGKVIFRVFLKLRNLGKNCLVNIIHLLHSLAKSLNDFIRWCLRQLIALPQRIKSSLIASFKIISLIMARVIFAAHVVIAIVWVACVYSFQLMRQMTDPVVKS